MTDRYYSLDIFRGATVALMILVNNPGTWAHIFTPFSHATWHGCTPTDLVFPFFLFAVGNAMAFIMPGLYKNGTRAFLKKVAKRTMFIFAIGLFLNWTPFVQWKDDQLVYKVWDNIRIFGVLQRIAVCYFFASLIVYFFKVKGALIISTILLAGYWLLCLFFGAEVDPYSLAGFFGTAVDKAVLGEAHMYRGEGLPFDPEGIVSTIPAIVNVVFGYFSGKFIKERGRTWEMLSNLFIAGSLMIFVAFFWDMAFPINKKIWTSSFVLYSVGVALIVLGILIYLLEFKHTKGTWSRFFDVFGKNPLFIFVLSGFLPRVISLFRWTDHIDDNGKPVYTSAFSWFYQHICQTG